MKSKHVSRNWAFDTEDNSRGRAFLFNFYDLASERHYSFSDQLSALDFVCETPRRVYWACNLEYDLNNLFRGHYGMLHFIYAGSRLIVAELPGDRIKFLDTMNHWPMSVKKMGVYIGLPKLEMQHRGFTPRSAELKKAIRLCERADRDR